MWKTSPRCVSVNVILNDQIVWISSNKLHRRKVSVCVSRCLSKLLDLLNLFWHVSHVKGFSPVCISICDFKYLARLNFFKKASQVKDFSPVLECVSVGVFFDVEQGRMSSNMFHMQKVSPQCVSVYVILNYYRVDQKKCTTFTKCRLHLLANPTTHVKVVHFFWSTL